MIAPIRRVVLAGVVSLMLAAPAAAQRTLTDDQKSELIAGTWRTIFAQVAMERGLVERDGQLQPRDSRIIGPRAILAVREAYAEMVERLVADSRLDPIFTPDLALIEQVTTEEEQEWVDYIKNSGLEGKSAKSLNANATNPKGNRGVERSGFSDLIAIAADMREFVGADASAISLNLNALALFSLKNDEVYSAQSIYRDHDALRRIGGTVTFGAKVPESEITGFKGVPSANRLLDVFAWDLKYRVYGDRDPRAGRWFNDMLGTMGGLTEVLAALPAFALPGDRVAVSQAAQAKLQLALARVKSRVARSTQIAIKGAGQHLTQEVGKNTFTVGVLADKGFGDTDLTVNVLYRATDEIQDVAGLSPFSARNLLLTAGVSTLVAQNAIIPGRAAQIGLDFNLDLPVQKEGPRTDLETIWRVVGTVSVPFGKAALIPVSITYTSDPNNLGKQNYIVGQIGIAYDFGGLKNLFE